MQGEKGGGGGGVASCATNRYYGLVNYFKT